MTDGQSEGARMSEETPLRELVGRHVIANLVNRVIKLERQISAMESMNERTRTLEAQVRFLLELLQPSDTEQMAEDVVQPFPQFSDSYGRDGRD